MSSVAAFLKKTTVKEFWKSAANICRSYERMYSGTVFGHTVCVY